MTEDNRSQQIQFSSFDGSISLETSYCLPDRYRYWETGPAQRPCISRGAGLSYPAASFSAGGESIDHARFNRILGFDSARGILEVEAGITLGRIYSFATRHGMMLAVQPGHPKITVGGCIGADVHGKNQFRDGTFLSQVESLVLFHQSHGLIELSREKNPELFFLTCGGYGLTGSIISVRLRLAKISSSRVNLRLTPIQDIFGLPSQLLAAAAQNDLIYSWHNFSASGSQFGRGFLVSGKFLPAHDTQDANVTEPKAGNLSAASRARLPFSFFNRFTIGPFNSLYELSLKRKGDKEEAISLYHFLFPVHDKQVYFYLFGRSGFHECQIIVEAQRFAEFATRLREQLQRHPVPITLASAKLFGGTRDLLRFSGAGICLSLNFPRSSKSLEFCRFLDELTNEVGGWPNIIKDSRLPAIAVASAYPEYDLFRNRLREFDPRRIYKSELSERLAL